MLIPFLAATAIAATFAQVGAMSVQISILTLAHKAFSVAPDRFGLGCRCHDWAVTAKVFA